MKQITCDFISGCFGGSCGILVGHPLDTIKTWQQFSNNKITTSMYNIIIRHNGLKGFYKGMFFPLLSSGALNSVVFAVYGAQLRKLQSYCQYDKDREKSWRKHVIIAGSVAGATQVLIGCPIEVVKVRLQTLQYVGHPWRCLWEIFHFEGIMGLYRGFIPMLWRDVVPYGIYMLVYEYMLEVEDRLHRMKRDRLSGTAVGSQYEASVIATAGATAGIVSWLFIVPFDVVKTVMQSETDPTVHKKMMDCFRSLVRHHGWRSLFRGSSMVIARAAPVNSATFLGYEWFLGQCHKNFTVDSS